MRKSRESPRFSDSSLFLPCRCSLEVCLTAVQLSEQLACYSHKEKRLGHWFQHTPVPRSSSQHGPKRHNTDRTQRWPREYQRAALTHENGYYGRVASDDLLTTPSQP